nr:biotin synthase BioB [Cohaesibacter intestini]
MANSEDFSPRHDWTREEVMALFVMPFNDLLFKAQSVHRANFPANEVQLSSLLNIKTGGCSEDCKYCSQSSRYQTGLQASKMLTKDVVKAYAQKAQAQGASRFCMGAAWKNLKDRDMERVAGIIQEVKNLGMETCMTLGMLSREQAAQLKDAGLDYYNHNVDTSPSHYCKVVTSHSYEDRLNTLKAVQEVGINVCSGGILGLGEEEVDRADMLCTLANLPIHPQSVPINNLVPVDGTPFAEHVSVESLDFIRMIAVARIVLPRSAVRLSAGRKALSKEGQALCFFAGANSIFYGETLLTTENPDAVADRQLLAQLGIESGPAKPFETHPHDLVPEANLEKMLAEGGPLAEAGE